MLPCIGEFRITSIQGMRQLPGREPKMHKGLDFVCKDKCIRAVKDGIVVVSNIITNRNNSSWAFGNRVWFRDKNGIIVCNNHLRERYVKTGEYVKEGDIIGYEGGTGDCVPAGASHLHFELRDRTGAGYKNFNAAAYLGIPNKTGSYNSETFYPTIKEPPIKDETQTFRHGDKVRISKITANGNRLYGRTYQGKLWRIYHDVYNVIGDQIKDRVVIGIGNTITAAVKAADLENSK